MEQVIQPPDQNTEQKQAPDGSVQMIDYGRVKKAVLRYSTSTDQILQEAFARQMLYSCIPGAREQGRDLDSMTELFFGERKTHAEVAAFFTRLTDSVSHSQATKSLQDFQSKTKGERAAIVKSERGVDWSMQPPSSWNGAASTYHLNLMPRSGPAKGFNLEEATKEHEEALEQEGYAKDAGVQLLQLVGGGLNDEERRLVFKIAFAKERDPKIVGALAQQARKLPPESFARVAQVVGALNDGKDDTLLNAIAQNFGDTWQAIYEFGGDIFDDKRKNFDYLVNTGLIDDGGAVAKGKTIEDVNKALIEFNFPGLPANDRFSLHLLSTTEDELKQLAAAYKEADELRKWGHQVRQMMRTDYGREHGFGREFAVGAVELLKYAAIAAAETFVTRGKSKGKLVFTVMAAESVSTVNSALVDAGVDKTSAREYAIPAGLLMAYLWNVRFTKWVGALNPKNYLTATKIAEGRARDYLMASIVNAGKTWVSHAGSATLASFGNHLVEYVVKDLARAYKGADFDREELRSALWEQIKSSAVMMPLLTGLSAGVGFGRSLSQNKSASGGAGNWMRSLVHPSDALEFNLRATMAYQQFAEKQNTLVAKYAPETIERVAEAHAAAGRPGAKDAESAAAAQKAARDKVIDEIYKGKPKEAEQAKKDFDVYVEAEKEVSDKRREVVKRANDRLIESMKDTEARARQKLESEASLSSDENKNGKWALVRDFIGKFGGKDDIVLVDDMAELPEALRDKVPDGARGMFDAKTGKYYLLGNNLADAVEALKTLAHERTHWLADRLHADPKFRALLQDVAREIGPENLTDLLGQNYEGLSDIDKAEEFLCRVCEKVALDQFVGTKERSVFQRFIDFLAQKFGIKDEQLDANLVKALAQVGTRILDRANVEASRAREKDAQAGREAAEEEAVEAQGEPAERNEPRASEKKADDGAPKPNYWRSSTPEENGETVSGVWRVVDESELVASTDEGYDDTLQPRNRTRRASTEQVAKIATSLNPARLDASETTDLGAPIVDARGQVLSGNGRTLAVRHAYDVGAERAEKYRAHVLARAREMGVEVPEGVRNPVLVREVRDTGKMSLQEFAQRSNKSQVARMSDSEQAVSDARVINEKRLMELFYPSDTGDVLAASNQEFVNEFLHLVGGREEYIDARGRANAALGKRIKRAVMVAMMNPEKREVAETLLEGDGWSALVNGLMNAAARLGKLRGNRDYDLSPEINDAAELYVRLRREGRTLEEYLSQGQMFEGAPSEAVVKLAELFEENRTTSSGISDVLGRYCDKAQRIDTTTDDMFGVQNPTKAELLESAKQDHIEQGEAPRMADEGETFREMPSDAERAEADRQFKGEWNKWHNPDGTPKEGYMKAPNGKDTKLTAEQWVWVRTPNFKRRYGDWENDPKNSLKVLDENGEPLVAHHGTARGDRVGNVFDPSKATSGPMAFFTDNREIAESYSKNKSDTSLSRDEDFSKLGTRFKVRLGDGREVDFVRSFYFLPLAERERLKVEAGHITFDDDYNIVRDENETRGTGGFDYHLKEAKGNVFKALVIEWLESGNLFREEERRFLDVLNLLGVKNVSYKDPYYTEPKVYDVFLNIKNPFDTSKISKKDINGLKRAAKKVHFDEREAFSADMWDKTNVSPENFIESLEYDLKNGTTTTWTSIPDWVSDYLKGAGYDGIKDKGGKGGGAGHTVWIPFYSNQIKDANNNVGTFSERRDIRYADEGETFRGMESAPTSGEISGVRRQAPNGKPTNLTEKQWIRVRTEEHKRWFGDWETLAQAKMPRSARTFKEAIDTLGAVFNKPLKNLYNGFEATVSKSSAGKMLSRSAVKKSISPEAQSFAVANIDHLFVNSKLLESKPDRNGDRNIESINRFYAPMLFKGELVAVKLTVKKFTNIAGSRIYSIESIDIKKAPTQSAEANLQAGGQPQYAETVNSFLKNLRAVKQENVSNVVDENGEPKVVYHGTNNRDVDYSNFKEFKGDVHFFSSSRDVAGSMGSYVYAAFLRMKNPLVIDAGGNTWGAIKDHTGGVVKFSELTEAQKGKLCKAFELSREELEASYRPDDVIDIVQAGVIKRKEMDSTEWSKYAKAKGHDGVIFKNLRDGADIGTLSKPSDVYAVFDSRNIKSAEDDYKGTYLESKNIYAADKGETFRRASVERAIDAAEKKYKDAQKINRQNAEAALEKKRKEFIEAKIGTWRLLDEKGLNEYGIDLSDEAFSDLARVYETSNRDLVYEKKDGSFYMYSDAADSHEIEGSSIRGVLEDYYDEVFYADKDNNPNEFKEIISDEEHQIDALRFQEAIRMLFPDIRMRTDDALTGSRYVEVEIPNSEYPIKVRFADHKKAYFADISVDSGDANGWKKAVRFVAERVQKKDWNEANFPEMGDLGLRYADKGETFRRMSAEVFSNADRKRIQETEDRRQKIRQEAEIWAKNANNIAKTAQKYIEKRTDKNGQVVIDPDEIRTYLPGYDVAFIAELKGAEEKLTDIIIPFALHNARKKTLVLLTGNPGAGKSFVREGELIKGLDEAGVILDAPLNSIDSVKRVLALAKAAGVKVQLVQIYNSPVKSYKNSIERGIKTGRFLPLSYFESAYKKAGDKVRIIEDELKKQYPDLETIYIDNSGDAPRKLDSRQARRWDYTISETQKKEIADYVRERKQEIAQSALRRTIPFDPLAIIGGGLHQIRGVGVERKDRPLGYAESAHGSLLGQRGGDVQGRNLVGGEKSADAGETFRPMGDRRGRSGALDADLRMSSPITVAALNYAKYTMMQVRKGANPDDVSAPDWLQDKHLPLKGESGRGYTETQRAAAVNMAKRIVGKIVAMRKDFAGELEQDKALENAAAAVRYEEVVNRAMNASEDYAELWGRAIERAHARAAKREEAARRAQEAQTKGLTPKDFEENPVDAILKALEAEPARPKRGEGEGTEADIGEMDGGGEGGAGAAQAKAPAAPKRIVEIIKDVRQTVMRKLNARSADKVPEGVYQEELRKTYVNVLTEAARSLTYGATRERVMREVDNLKKLAYSARVLDGGERAGQKIDNLTLRAERIAQMIFEGGVRDTKAQLAERMYQALRFVRRGKATERDDKRKISGAEERRLTAIKRALALTPDEVDAELEELTNKLSEKPDDSRVGRYDDYLDDIMTRLDAVARFGNFRDKTRGEMAELVEEVERGYAEAAAAQEARVEEKKAADDARRKVFLDAILARAHNAGDDGALRKAVRGILNYGTMYQHRLEDLGRYASGDVAEQFNALVADLSGRIYRASSAKLNEVYRVRGELAAFMERTYGRDYGKEIARLMEKREEWRRFSTSGNKLSAQQMLQLLAAAEQPDYRRNIALHRAQTDAVRAAKRAIDELSDKLAKLQHGSAEYEAARAELDKAYEALDQACETAVEDYVADLRAEISRHSRNDLELLNWLRDYYERTRPELSKIQKDITGYAIVPRDALGKYMPVSVAHDAGMGEEMNFIPLVPKSLTPRISHLRDINENKGVLDLFTSRLEENAHYKAFAKLHMDLRGIFAHEDFHKAVKNTMGADVLKELLDHTNDVLSVRPYNRERVAAVDCLVNWHQLSALGFSLGVGFRQLSSIPAFALYVPAVDVVRYMASWATPEGVAAIKEILQTETARRRLQIGNNQILNEMLAEPDANTFVRLIKKWSPIFNKMGDMTAISTIGQGIYRAGVDGYLRRGWTLEAAKERAMSDMWNITELSQQSGATINLSRWQRRGGSAGRLLGSFTSTVNQYLSKELLDLRHAVALYTKARETGNAADIKARNSALMQAAKDVILNHVFLAGGYALMTSIYQWFLGDDWDEDDAHNFLGAMAAGPSNGMFVFGRFVSSLASGGGVNVNLAPAASFGVAGKAALDLCDAVCDGDGDRIVNDFDRILKGLVSPWRDLRKAGSNETWYGPEWLSEYFDDKAKKAKRARAREARRK